MKCCTRHGSLILSQLKWELRFEALKSIVKAFTPGKYPIAEMVRILGFSSNLSGVRWLKQSGAEFDDTFILCQKCTALRPPRVRQRKDVDKGVTHGSLM
mmetsp:Transcript_30661/g.53808  ORF Transcript_30661/g.53808 Transcript_30661/m.53808 type:complete len:99 (-) Transcript_30661:94-390(-)